MPPTNNGDSFVHEPSGRAGATDGDESARQVAKSENDETTSGDAISRRSLLLTLGAVGAGALLGSKYLREGATAIGDAVGGGIPGETLGTSHRRGHALRDGTIATGGKPQRITTGVLIIGGGIAGLSAARKLLASGRKDVLLIELEDRVGGKSVGGENDAGRWPWGAHYLPVPSTESHLVRGLLDELGVIQGYEDGRPRFDPAILCHAPHERLFRNGRWQLGLVPSAGVDQAGMAQIRRFRKMTADLARKRGPDGRRVFAIPVALSSTSVQRALDDITFATWLDKQGFVHHDLRWYLDYCCRDDYGADTTRVSAWAGLHYFASRDGVTSEGDEDHVLTWPEGNTWLAEKLRDKVSRTIRTGVMAHRVSDRGGHVEVDAFDFSVNQPLRIEAARVIWAAPQFVGQRVVSGLAARAATHKLPDYAAWMVANVRVKVDLRSPIGSPNQPRKHAPLAWDNVIQAGESLGYVNGNHQRLGVARTDHNLTLYWPMDRPDPATGRRLLMQRTHAEWVDAIIAELELAHPGVRRQIERIDVWRWGHGMAVARPGYLWTDGPARARPLGRVHFAHADLTGISTFEEAQFHGDRAAREVLAA